MTRRPGAIFLACGLGIGLAIAGADPVRLVHAQSADLVLCDRLAADPTDPDKPADVKGVAAIDRADFATAIKFCRVAAATSRRAVYQLGRAYAANQQMADALAAYRKAADKGSSAAMVELAIMLMSATGGRADEPQARALLARAAAAGNPRALASLATLAGPSGAASDPAAARAMLTKAAEANSAEAQFQLGVMTSEGNGGPKDDAAARALFEKAAAQNHVDALLWAGAFASQGRGGPSDARAAKSYYERAVALGSEDAKAALKRLECPYVLKDKAGKVVTNLCF